MNAAWKEHCNQNSSCYNIPTSLVRLCTALIYANRRAAKECELIPEVLGKEDSLDEHHELSMILDRLEANASEAMAKGIRAIRLSAEGYSHAEIGSILGESD